MEGSQIERKSRSGSAAFSSFAFYHGLAPGFFSPILPQAVAGSREVISLVPLDRLLHLLPGKVECV
jgi:hypothetical protein